MKVTADNYEKLKAFWITVICALYPNFRESNSPSNPIVVLEIYEAKSRATARKSLESGIGDVLEMTQRISLENVRINDKILAEAGLPTLTEVRLLFWKRISSIMERGRIRSEKEYHMLRNVADGMAGADQLKAWRMIDSFGIATESGRRDKKS